jgi:hypothetical protein
LGVPLLDLILDGLEKSQRVSSPLPMAMSFGGFAS